MIPWTVACQPPLSMRILQARILEWVRGSSRRRDRTQSPKLWADSLTSEPLEKPKNTGVGSLSLLQGIFPTQELNQGLLYRRRILYQLSHQGSPRIQEWIVYPFSRESSQPRNQTGVSCTAGNSLPAEVPGKPLTRSLPPEYAYVHAQSFSHV